MNRPAEQSSPPTCAMRPSRTCAPGSAQMEAAGELQHVARRRARARRSAASSTSTSAQTGNKAVLFDDIPGYPTGYRVVANILTSMRRIKLTLGLPADATEMDLVALLAQLHEGGEDHPAGARCRPGC